MGEIIQDTLDIPVCRGERGILRDLMLDIEATLKRADDRTQSDELIDTYVEVWGTYNDLVGIVVPESGITDAFVPSQYVIDLVAESQKLALTS
jgi:hypothetical protein